MSERHVENVHDHTVHCSLCGGIFKLGEQHTCGTYRVTYTDQTSQPPKRIMVDGHWYVLEEEKQEKWNAC